MRDSVKIFVAFVATAVVLLFSVAASDDAAARSKKRKRLRLNKKTR